MTFMGDNLVGIDLGGTKIEADQVVAHESRRGQPTGVISAAARKMP